MGVTVHVKVSSGGKFTVEVELSQTVAEVKEKLVEQSEVPAAQQRLIYKGRVLKDENTLASYGMEADHTIHLVRGAAPPSSAASTPVTTPSGGAQPSSTAPGIGLPAGLGGFGMGGQPFLGQQPDLAQMQQQLMQNPNMMREMMGSPAVQTLLNNPELMRGIVNSNPQLREILDRNPELNHVLNDPSIIRQTVEAARNPELMREMMRTTDRAMSNLESHPEGFNALRRMYETVQEPLMNAATQPGGDGTNTAAANSFAALFGQQGQGQATTTGTTPSNAPAGPAPNTAPLPNPWGPPSAQGAAARGAPAAAVPAGLGGAGFPDLGLGMGMGGGGMPPPAQMMQMLQDPGMQQMMQSVLSNPQMLQQLINMNPQLRTMVDGNPQFREMMQNPEFVRQLGSPETFQQMMQLQSLFGGLQGAGAGGVQRDGAALGGGAMPDLGALLGMFGGGQAAAQSNVPPEERFATQLTQLRDMGFFDEQENIRALLASNGNVNAAVERLLAGPG